MSEEDILFKSPLNTFVAIMTLNRLKCGFPIHIVVILFFFGHFYNGLGNAAALHFDHVAAQLGSQFEVIDQVSLLGQPDPARRFSGVWTYSKNQPLW